MTETLQEASGLSRRDALKIAGAASAAMMMMPSSASAATKAHASSANGHVVIIGAGAGGISVAAKLKSMASNLDITIVDATEEHHYQPAYTMIGTGIVDADYPVAPNADYIPSGVKWVKEMAVEIDGANNQIKTDKGNTIGYDALIVGAGNRYVPEEIEGLSMDKFGKNGLVSLYGHQRSQDTWKAVQALAKEAKNRKVTALFHESHTPIKCAGAPKKIMMLMEDYFRKQGVRENVELILVTPGGKMFGAAEVYNKALFEVYDSRNMKYEWGHKLVKIDPENRVGYFEQAYDEFDEDLQIEVKKTRMVEKNYDFMHIAMPQRAASVIADNAELSYPNSFMNVDNHTLQSPTYPNIFGIGDIMGVPMGKTGGSVRKHYPVVAQNVIDVLEGRQPSAKFNGYTVCPLLTRYGSIIMAEFGYKINGEDNVMPSVPLDPGEERWMWWLLKVYLLKPMYYSGMLRGKA